VHAIVGKHSWVSSTLLLAVAIGAALVCVPLFARFARRTSKRRAYSLSMLAAAATFPLLGLAGLLPGIPATCSCSSRRRWSARRSAPTSSFRYP
jgi:MFS family permease